MNHLKLFETLSQYETFKGSSDFMLPNVSYILEFEGLPMDDPNKSVMYNPYVAPKENRIVCTYNVTDITGSTRLYNNIDYPQTLSSIEIDGVKIDIDISDWRTYENYNFTTTGEHVVKFELIDPTTIEEEMFNGLNTLTSVFVPDTVTTVKSRAFANCTNLTEANVQSSVFAGGTFEYCSNLTKVTYGPNVTSIGPDEFYSCKVNEIICNALTPPDISSYTFEWVKRNGVLKVPAGSDYSSWLSTEEAYLGYYNWTIEYI